MDPTKKISGQLRADLQLLSDSALGWGWDDERLTAVCAVMLDIAEAYRKIEEAKVYN